MSDVAREYAAAEILKLVRQQYSAGWLDGWLAGGNAVRALALAEAERQQKASDEGGSPACFHAAVYLRQVVKDADALPVPAAGSAS